MVATLLALVFVAAACGSSTDSVTETADDAATATADESTEDAETDTSTDTAAGSESESDSGSDTDSDSETDAGSDTDPDTGSASDTASDDTTSAASGSGLVGNAPTSCDGIAAAFVTNGSANEDLADPEVAGTCTGDTVVVTSNQIPDFPYVETSPGQPRAAEVEVEFPVTPTMADETSDIARVGAIAIAVNGIPIFGATEGTGGDVMSLGGGFTECGGHNGPSGYHYHTFDVTGSDECLFSEAEATSELILFGYAFDGFPIYGGNFVYESSWELTDESLFASDTFGAHTYIEGSGDLDECNGRFDENGNYAYYTTDTFPYTLGCYSGVVDAAAAGGGGQGPGQGEGPGGQGPPPGEDGENAQRQPPGGGEGRPEGEGGEGPPPGEEE